MFDSIVKWDVLALLAFIPLQAFYRLYLYPLARSPGPELVAVTSWYEFYYDAIRKGQYFRKVEQMHAVYGRYAKFWN
jgi:hypothetical protein